MWTGKFLLRELVSNAGWFCAMLRRILNALYLGGALAGAGSIVAIGLLIVSQVTGRELGVLVKGADDLTAWSVVAAGFLPLAYTYRQNRHIRVTVVVEQLGGWRRRFLEIFILLVSLFLASYMTYSAFDMIRDSFRFEELSQNLIVIPIWIPQSSIAVGSLLLAIAIMDDLVVSLLGGQPAHVVAGEASRASERSQRWTS